MVKISRDDKRFSRLRTPTLSDIDFLERYDLQECIFNSPDAFCEEIRQELMIIDKEVRPSSAVGDRIDLLAIDRDGTVVILELKRGNHKLQLLQAISYAGMVAKWSPEELLQRAGNRGASIEEFVEADEVNQDQRIILVAEAYDYEVLVGAEWLYEKDVDIACVCVAVAVDETTKAEYLSFTQVFPTPGLDEIAKSRGRRRNPVQPPAEGPASWDQALSTVSNEALAEFFKLHLAANRSNNLKYLDLHFPIGGKRRFTVKLRGNSARVSQHGRFASDLEFWRTRLSEPDVRTGTKVHHNDRVRFELITPEDFKAFEKAVDEELKTLAWVDGAELQAFASSPGPVADPDRSSNPPSLTGPIEKASERATGN